MVPVMHTFLLSTVFLGSAFMWGGRAGLWQSQVKYSKNLLHQQLTWEIQCPLSKKYMVFKHFVLGRLRCISPTHFCKFFVVDTFAKGRSWCRDPLGVVHPLVLETMFGDRNLGSVSVGRRLLVSTSGSLVSCQAIQPEEDSCKCICASHILKLLWYLVNWCICSQQRN